MSEFYRPYIDGSQIDWYSENLGLRIVDFTRTRTMELITRRFAEGKAINNLGNCLENGLLSRKERPFSLEKFILNLNKPNFICVYNTRFGSFGEGKNGYQNIVNLTLTRQSWRIGLIVEALLEQDRLVAMGINTDKIPLKERKIRGVITTQNLSNEGEDLVRSLTNRFGVPVYNTSLELNN